MKIGILSIAEPNSGGVYQYTVSLLEALRSHGSSEFDYIQIRHSGFPKIMNRDSLINNKKSGLFLKLKRGLYSFMNVKIGDIVGVYNNPVIKNIDLIISPVISFHPYYIGKPYVITIHDFQHKYYPSFFTLKEIFLREITYRASKKANFIICESNYVKQDLIKFLNVPEEKIKIIPSPPNSYLQKVEVKSERLDYVRQKYNLPEKYLFYPAQFWFHKNHKKIIEAIAYIRDFHREKINLILVGSKKNNFENTINLIKEANLSHQIRWLGYVSDEELAVIYKSSVALVMPTLFESVSMPIWEAFYLGVPVVSSNICALPEQVGNAGLLFDPNSVEDMAEKICNIWSDGELREILVKKGYERIKDLTFENYADQWEEVFEKVLRR